VNGSRTLQGPPSRPRFSQAQQGRGKTLSQLMFRAGSGVILRLDAEVIGSIQKSVRRSLPAVALYRNV
jgi:hypothetical protein